MRVWLLLLALSILPACAPKTITDPATRAAYTADQLIIRLGELQGATIDAALAGKIPLDTGREIVTWISGDVRATPPVIGAVTVVQTAPAGWRVTVKTGWEAVRPKLNAVPTLSVYVIVIDALIGGL